MAKIGELVLEIVVDAKRGTAVIKNFSEVVDKATQDVTKRERQLRNPFDRVAEFAQRAFLSSMASSCLKRLCPT